MNKNVVLRLSLGIMFLSSLNARADNWPQWRGPHYDGVSQEKNLPVTWGPGKNLAWQLPLPGMSSATPAVWEDRIFLTSDEGKDIVLLCVSTQGKELWKRRIGGGGGRKRGLPRREEGNDASPSPSTDGKHVWAFIGGGDLVCFDFDGREIWRVNTQERYGKFRIQFGMHSTPLLYGNRLYLTFLHSGGYHVVALDKATGKEVWKIERASDCENECEHAYTSPTLWHKGDQAYLVVHGNDYTTGHRLEDGSEIWRLSDLNPKARYHPTLRFVASPVATPDLIVIPTAKNGPIVGVKPEARGSFVTGSPYEQWRRAANTPDVPSPLVYDGLVYLCRENGVLICLDGKTGKELYQQPLHRAIYRASPAAGDGKIYCAAQDGTVSVVQAGPSFQLLAVNKLPDELNASPVIANGRIYLRGWSTLFAIGN